MKWKKQGMVLAICAVLLIVGLAPVQAQEQLSDPVQQAPIKGPAIKPVATGYTPTKLLGNLGGGPRGVGVLATGNIILFNTYSDKTLWGYSNKNKQSILTTASPLQASRMISKYYVVGDDAGNIYYLDPQTKKLKTLASLGSGYITGLDIDTNGDIYFIELTSKVLYKLPKGSKTPVRIATLGFSSWGVAVSGNTLYVTDTYGGNIYKLPKTGGSLTKFVSGLGGATDLDSDTAGNLYIADYYGGSISYIKAGSTTIQKIATGFNTPYYLGLDSAGNVYFTDYGNAELWELKRI